MSTFIIAEIGINHNGDINMAKQMIDEAKKCGVDAVKFQTFKAEEFITDKNLTYTYKSQGKDVTESQIEMFKRYEFNIDEWKSIFEHCDAIGIIGFTTPQNESDLDFIMSITDLKLLKVGSDDLTNLPLLEYYASKNIPMIISTGMSYEKEIAHAILTIKHSGCKELSVLHCVSSYPTKDEDVNMKKMLSIKNKFGVDIGFSDHTIDHFSSVMAVSMGAKVIEKHFTLDRDLPGPDHWFSSDPKEMKTLVDNIRKTEIILGDGNLVPTDKEEEMRKIARRSIVFKKNFQKGTVLSKSNFEFKRPGTGLPPSMVDSFIGKKLIVDVVKGSMITGDIIND